MCYFLVIMRRSFPIFVIILAVAIGCDDGTDGGDAGVDSGNIDDIFIIGGGSHLAIMIGEECTFVNAPVDPYSLLDDEAGAAVDRTPAWIQTDLASTLSSLNANTAAALADQINGADEQWLDEVAWSIAVTDAPMLEWIVADESEALFSENAEAIYTIDEQLDYVAIVDLDDGRSTLELMGENGEFLLDVEKYYWYVVYPRAYFELPKYESGSFWRTFLVEDDSYDSTLLEHVSGAQDLPAAVLGIGEWIQSFMTFQYGTNPPGILAIYNEPIGSCGQYAMITSAASRAVLVPVATASARADDHEWNEYWDERWIMWDNSLGEIGSNPHYPYIDMPEIFDDDTYDGAGVLGELAHVFRFRPDDNIFASELYTAYKDVVVGITDSIGEPVEGARVIVGSAEAGNAPCTWSYTDVLGEAAFRLGDDLGYRIEASHPILGEQDSYGVVWTNTPDELYTVDMQFTVPYPRLVQNVGDLPTGDIAVQLDFEVIETEQRRINQITEGYELGFTHPVILEGGVVDVFVLNASAYQAFLTGSQFDGHSVSLATGGATTVLHASSDGQPLYLVFDNTLWPTSEKRVRIRLVPSE